jgi:hypothetical protein
VDSKASPPAPPERRKGGLVPLTAPPAGPLWTRSTGLNCQCAISHTRVVFFPPYRTPRGPHCSSWRVWAHACSAGRGGERVLKSTTTQHSKAQQRLGKEDLRRTPSMAVSSRERTSQRSTGPLQCLALETHWRASAVRNIASSAAGTKRTRSCSPTTQPSHGLSFCLSCIAFYLFTYAFKLCLRPWSSFRCQYRGGTMRSRALGKT